MSEAKTLAEKDTDGAKKKFEANVFETYDASTGLKIEESNVESLSASAIKEVEQTQPATPKGTE